MSEVKCSTCKGTKTLTFERGQRCVPCVTRSGSGIDWRKTCEAAQSELTALREELAKFEGEIVAALPGVRFMDLPDGGAPTLGDQVKRMLEALTAAEQRNAALENLVRQFQGVAYGGFLDDDHLLRMQRDIDAALKPTESGASE